jgi:hypothetical protein
VPSMLVYWFLFMFCMVIMNIIWVVWGRGGTPPPPHLLDHAYLTDPVKPTCHSHPLISASAIPHEQKNNAFSKFKTCSLASINSVISPWGISFNAPAPPPPHSTKPATQRHWRYSHLRHGAFLPYFTNFSLPYAPQWSDNRIHI